jgi:hypothetical protein
MFGPFKADEQRILDIAEEFGELLWGGYYEIGMDYERLCKLLGFMYSYSPDAFVQNLAKSFREQNVGFQNQVIAAGRVFSCKDDFEVFVDSFKDEDPYPSDYTKWYFWSFMRCLCYYAGPARLPAEKASAVYCQLRNYLVARVAQAGDQVTKKYALCAVLFGLRIRELDPDFLGENDDLRKELVAVISDMHTQLPFPPTMFRGTDMIPNPGDNLNRYVIRFLKYEETAEDRVVAGGLAAGG